MKIKLFKPFEYTDDGKINPAIISLEIDETMMEGMDPLEYVIKTSGLTLKCIKDCERSELNKYLLTIIPNERYEHDVERLKTHLQRLESHYAAIKIPKFTEKLNKTLKGLLGDFDSPILVVSDPSPSDIIKYVGEINSVHLKMANTLKRLLGDNGTLIIDRHKAKNMGTIRPKSINSVTIKCSTAGKVIINTHLEKHNKRTKSDKVIVVWREF